MPVCTCLTCGSGRYKDTLYTKHASSDCMDEAIGGGFGEKSSTVIAGLKEFLIANKKETVVLSFSHFCAKEAPMAVVAQNIIDELGKDLIYANGGKKLADVTLNELAGKRCWCLRNTLRLISRSIHALLRRHQPALSTLNANTLLPTALPT